jgi:hypothetical protein
MASGVLPHSGMTTTHHAVRSRLLRLSEDDPRMIADAAFDRAILAGRLSVDPSSPHYAGHYMFMGTNAAGVDTFKHRDTREYLR